MNSDAGEAAVRSNGIATPVPPEALAQFGLAHGWLRRGHPDRAIQHFRRALELDPDLEGAHVKLATILAGHRCWKDAIDACEAGLERFPTQAVLHKTLIDTLTQLGGHDAALERHGLNRVDDRAIELDPGEVIGCLVVRDEAARLPWFLAENRRLGVTTFLVVDNGSTDGSLELLSSQPDLHLWQTDASFNAGNFGSAWFEVILSRHGLGHWVVMLDADEILCYPGYEDTPVREFCRSLDRAGIRAASGLMLDMYSDTTIAETRYIPGDDFLAHCQHFDRTALHSTVEKAGPFDNHTFHFGGARRRVFGDDVEYLVTKTPLVRYDSDVVLAGGQHWTSHPAERIAHDGCAVLHFKYFASFADYVEREAEREEHSEGAKQYKAYRKTLDEAEAFSLFDPAESVRFEHSTQLHELGLVDDGWRVEQALPAIPEIRRRPDPTDAPRWSVMVTVFDRLHLVERALRSVLDQAPPDMHVAVVADHHSDTTTEALRALVGDMPDVAERVELHLLDTRVGHPHIFNAAIDLARGDWVHILHDDDFVNPGFYDALDDGIRQAPDIGAAFVRHELPSERGHTWTSWLEHDTAGVIDDWLDRIAIECRVQFSAMTVQRAVYEDVGGFRTEIGSAFDWEMWQRVASRFAVWFDPRPLAVVQRDGTAETDRLISDGGQIADSITAIEHARRHLPADRVDLLTARARERFALHGLDLARTQLRAGYPQSALRNIAAALEASDGARVIAALRRLLAEESDPGVS